MPDAEPAQQSPDGRALEDPGGLLANGGVLVDGKRCDVGGNIRHLVEFVSNQATMLGDVSGLGQRLLLIHNLTIMPFRFCLQQ